MDGQDASGVAAAKGTLRARILAARGALPAGHLEAAGAAITATVLALPLAQAAGTVAAYISMRNEVPTWPLIEALTGRGTTVLLPVLELDNSLTWRAYTGAAALVTGRHGLLHPPAGEPPRELTEADVVLLPGLCYDARGNRLGRGGGSYDRALADLPPAITTVGIALDSDIVGLVPVDEHDQQVQMIITPTRVISTADGSH